MEKVAYFPDTIAEKEDHIIRLNGGSSWLLAHRCGRSRRCDGRDARRHRGRKASTRRLGLRRWRGDSREHVEGVYPSNPAFLTRVVASEDQGAKLRLADGTALSCPGYNRDHQATGGFRRTKCC